MNSHGKPTPVTQSLEWKVYKHFGSILLDLTDYIDLVSDARRFLTLHDTMPR